MNTTENRRISQRNVYIGLGSVITLTGLLSCIWILAQDESSEFKAFYALPKYEVPNFETYPNDYTLWNECNKMRLVVEGLSEDGEDIGLTESRIQKLFESRLRAARLYTEELSVQLDEKYLVRSSEDERLSSPDYYFTYDPSRFNDYLYVNVHVYGVAIHYSLRYSRHLADLGFGTGGVVDLWTSKSVTGTHGNDSSLVMNSLSERLDSFILSYLKVNEEACEAK